MYIPRNWEFASALAKLRNFGPVEGGGGGVETPLRYTTDYRCAFVKSLIRFSVPYKARNWFTQICSIRHRSLQLLEWFWLNLVCWKVISRVYGRRFDSIGVKGYIPFLKWSAPTGCGFHEASRSVGTGCEVAWAWDWPLTAICVQVEWRCHAFELRRRWRLAATIRVFIECICHIGIR
jgi:hypothetical protein